MADGVKVAVTIDDRAFQQSLRMLIDRGIDQTDIMDNVASEIEANIRLAFTEQTAPDGERWLPSQRAIRQSGSTLIDHRDLYDSLSSRVVGGAAVAGFQRVYAAVHNFGGKAGRGRKITLPQRRFMPENEGELDFVVDFLADWLAQVPGVSR